MSAWDDIAHLEHDVLGLARAAKAIAAHRVPRLDRWLALELDGYGHLTPGTALHRLLGVHADEPLVMQVASYRIQRSVPADDGTYVRESWPHFFTESLDRLLAVAALVRRNPGPRNIVLKFTPVPSPEHPLDLEFDPGVFDRILDGFRLVLYVQLRQVP